MDYVKRDIIKDEIDILINRICVLQEQEKTYKDLSKKISTHLNTLKTLEKEIYDKSIVLNEKTSQIEELDMFYTQQRDLMRKDIQKQESLEKEVQKRTKASLATKEKIDLQIIEKKKDMELVKKDIEQQEKDLELVKSKHNNEMLNIENDKRMFFEKVANNEIILQNQEKKILELTQRQNLIKSEVEELEIILNDKQEAYILTI